MPAEWAEDKQRRRPAGVPEEICFATQPVLARQMIERALANGVPARWVNSSIDLKRKESFRDSRCRVGLRADTFPAQERLRCPA